MRQCTRLNTWTGRGALAGLKHAKLVMLPEAIRSEARTWLDQELVHDGIFTEHHGDEHLRQLHAYLPEPTSSRSAVWRPRWTPPTLACGTTSSSRRRVRGGPARALPRNGVHLLECGGDGRGRRRAVCHAGVGRSVCMAGESLHFPSQSIDL
jgi:hypothetical protein